ARAVVPGAGHRRTGRPAAARWPRHPGRGGRRDLQRGADDVPAAWGGRTRGEAGRTRQLDARTGQRRRGGGRPQRRTRAHGPVRPADAATAGAAGPAAGARRPSLHQWFRTELGSDPGGPASEHARTVMNRKGDKSLIVGLDIGTSKVVALVGEYTAEDNRSGNPIEVIGIGSHESRGLRRGVVVDI